FLFFVGAFDRFLIPGRSQQPQPVAPPFVDRRLADDRKQPGLERRPSVETSFAFERLEVSDLKHVFGFTRVARATAQRPAIAFAMVPFKLSAQLVIVHQHGLATLLYVS